MIMGRKSWAYQPEDHEQGKHTEAYIQVPPVLETCLQTVHYSTAGIAFFGTLRVLGLPLLHLLRKHNRMTASRSRRGVQLCSNVKSGRYINFATSRYR